METLEELESRIRTLYAALIRAEVKAHEMREAAKPPVEPTPDWSAA